MTHGYFWPDTSAANRVSAAMGLKVTGREQDWEIELASYERLPEMLDLFRRGGLDFEAQSALGLLMLHAIDKGDVVPGAAVDAIRSALAANPEVLERMRSYWTRLEPLEPYVRTVLDHQAA